jgi:hypothetical protein
MASDAGLRGEMRTPGQISRRGCLFALLALVIWLCQPDLDLTRIS